RYYVRVVAVSGASTYVLHVSDEVLPPQPRRAKRLSDPFVPGQVLVTRTAQTMPARLGVRAAPAGSGLQLEAIDVTDARAASLRIAEPRIAAGAVVDAARRTRLDTLVAARRVAAEPSVAGAELNTLRRPHRRPNDPFYARQWHFRDIGL